MIPQFLNSEPNCPLCNEPLKLYMNWQNIMFFKGKTVAKNAYWFDNYYANNPQKGANPQLEALAQDSMLMTIDGDKVIAEFNSNALANEAKSTTSISFISVTINVSKRSPSVILPSPFIKAAAIINQLHFMSSRLQDRS